MSDSDPFSTHEVLNQSPIFGDIDLYASDQVLSEAIHREGGEGAAGRLRSFGALAGSRDMLEEGRLANESPPRLRRFDEKGRPLDIVEYHPAYHRLMATSMAAGLHCSVWEHLATPGASPRPGAHVERAGAFYMAAQMEAGHCCPITMTSAAVATLIEEPAIARVLLPRILSRDYDRRIRPMTDKTAITIGMGMTEKQGGTDVRANTTRATPIANGGPGGEYLITGHKWFMSAPMSDAFLVLAQAPGGLACFLMPRLLPDGSANPIRIQRLKDKLGNRSNASAEVEFARTSAWMIGEEGRGIATILAMVTLTRLDCAVSSAGLMRLCLANALLHTRHRKVFGRVLADEPVMTPVLADLALEVEAATALAFRLARAFDHAGDEGEAAFRRLMTPVVKYLVCKTAPGFAAEAMECLGGNGYVEEGLLARAYRELPVNAIWEGSGNVMCLDVLRVMMKEPDAVESVLDGLAKSVAGDRRIATALERVRDILHRPRDIELNARAFVEGLAAVSAAALLRASAPQAVADAYVATRLEGGFARHYGVGLARADMKAIVARALPAGT
ncbi:MAG: isovaleryl-CoA dehydrogenase [Hyphomicrobiaceae bacterium]